MANAVAENALSVSEAAQRLNVRLESIYRALYSKHLTGDRIDGKWAISAESVENYAACYSRPSKEKHQQGKT